MTKRQKSPHEQYPHYVARATTPLEARSQLRGRGLVITSRGNDRYALASEADGDNPKATAIEAFWDRERGKIYADFQVPHKRRHGGRRTPSDDGPRLSLPGRTVLDLARLGRSRGITDDDDDRAAARETIDAMRRQLVEKKVRR